jgi:hypothetical protein
MEEMFAIRNGYEILKFTKKGFLSVVFICYSLCYFSFYSNSLHTQGLCLHCLHYNIKPVNCIIWLKLRHHSTL